MTDSGDLFLERLAGVEPAVGTDPSWLARIRRSSFDWVSEHGFPTTRDEAWKYTSIQPILSASLEPARPGGTGRMTSTMIDELAGDFGGPRLVFLNGYCSRELSSFEGMPQGTVVTTLGSMLLDKPDSLEPLLSNSVAARQRTAFSELNSALARDGAFVEIPAEATIGSPIHLVFISETGDFPTASHPRSFVRAGPRSRVAIVETHVGLPGQVYLSNSVTEVALSEGAIVEHYQVQNQARTAFHLSLLDVRQGRGSRFLSHSIALGSSIARHEVQVRLEGEGAETILNGIYLPGGSQHLDNATTVEHIASRCTCREFYKGVVDGEGQGVFDGRIIVHPGADGTDAGQTNKNLLLSESAQVHTRPRLEIFADDVKCSHGAAVGQLDEEALFYLQSRGIPRQDARNLLAYAFAREMLERIGLLPLRRLVARLLESRFPKIGAEVAA